MRYESRHVRPISNQQFFIRMLTHGGGVVVLLAISTGVGMLGYRHYEHLSWPDAFLNASMLLSGEGPIEVPRSLGGKMFAACFALYSGLVFLASAGVLFVPVAHRILHHLHWRENSTGE